MFLFLFGTKYEKTVDLDERSINLYCDKCSTKTRFDLYRKQKYFHIFFIPLFTIDEEEMVYECSICRKVFYLLSDIERAKKAKKNDKYYKKYLRYHKKDIDKIRADSEKIEEVGKLLEYALDNDNVEKLKEVFYPELDGENLSVNDFWDYWGFRAVKENEDSLDKNDLNN